MSNTIHATAAELARRIASGEQSSEEVTQAMDEVCEAVGDQLDAFSGSAARRTLERVEW